MTIAEAMQNHTRKLGQSPGTIKVHNQCFLFLTESMHRESGTLWRKIIIKGMKTIKEKENKKVKLRKSRMQKKPDPKTSKVFQSKT